MKSAHVALLSISSCAILCLVAVLKRRQSRASRRRRVESNAFYRASQAAFASHAAAASQPGPPPIADTSADNAVVQASPSLPLLLLDERELPLASIATGVALAQADGRLNRAAVGFSRSPCHECRLPASLHYARRKRWNYWAITSDTHLFSVTIADLDYAGLVFAYLYDRTTRQLSEVELIAPLAAGIRLGNRVESPARSAKSRWLAADFVNQLASRRDRIGDRASVTQLHTRCSSFPWMSVDDARTDAGTNTAQTQQQQQQQQGATTARPRVKHALSSKLTVSYPAHHETLNVVIPWNDVEFHFTAKHTLLPVDGTVELTDASGRVQSVRFSAANNSV
ncbi:sigma-70 region 2 domain-containing protein [Capsaspora owczarzaki ATCC 30864]|uniref:sigma-70 region 2 domain-containing protein n=1 Tax=Capsaspora owczarzaki (strain ATCC 30864) TaxID=595528 RepID=UPI0001FE4101|nr:sigma-70 region 2 domain-containing protein [Capsaspora owczarzaki ATCC 30864]|eukprot:XP_004346166.1 sigma-70 region 2 domain-containing protein [Capsaspora owczarzaki ATCC 30864]